MAFLLAVQLAGQQEESGPRFEVGGFGGGQFWKINRGTYPYPIHLSPGFLVGGRGGVDFTRRWGGEVSAGIAGNEEGFDLRPSTGLSHADFGARNLQVLAGPTMYLWTRQSRFRPFVTVGGGLERFWPTGGGKQQAQNLDKYAIGAVQLRDNITGALFYGGGVKAWLTDKLNARIDFRHIVSMNPRIRYFSSPLAGDAAALPDGTLGHAFQAMVGLGYTVKGQTGWDRGAAGPERNPALKVQVTGPTKDVYQGDPAAFRAESNAQAGTDVAYNWRIGDQNTGTGDTVSIDTTNFPPGTYPVTVTAAAAGMAAAKAMSSLTVLPATAKGLNVSIAGFDRRAYRGDKVSFEARSEAPAGTPVTYAWMLNGKPAGDGAAVTVDTSGLAAGSYSVEATGNAPGYKSSSGAATLQVLEPKPPQIRLSIPAGDVKYGDRVPLTASVEKGEGGGTPGPVTFAVSEGAVSGNQFDTSTVPFDVTRPGMQRRTVNVTASVTDERGLMAKANGAVTVVRTISADPVRLPDVVFALNQSRVNNCGKRVLLEELKAYLDRDPTGRVVLIAHVDAQEAELVKRRRGMNAAAVITAGSGICLGVNPAQVLIGLAGPKQGSEPMPYLCGTSTEGKGTVRGGKVVRIADRRAQQRRVEVWFVPAGAKLPSGAAKLNPASFYKVSTLGCPR